MKWIKLNRFGSILLATCKFSPYGSENVFFSYLWGPIQAGDHPVFGPALIRELSGQRQFCSSLHLTVTQGVVLSLKQLPLSLCPMRKDKAVVKCKPSWLLTPPCPQGHGHCSQRKRRHVRTKLSR